MKYMVAVSNDSDLILAVGYSQGQGNEDYPIDDGEKIGIWADIEFDECPSCNEGQHLELIDNSIVIVDD